MSSTGSDTDRWRVLWLIKGLGPGGAERLLVAAATAHDREVFDIEAAYLLPWKDHLVAELEALGVPCTCLGVRDERDLRWTLRLRRLLTHRSFDVVHIHSPYAAGFARLVALSLPKAKRPRLVTTEHNPWSTYRRPTWLANALSAPLDRAVLAVSEEARASLPRRRRQRAATLAHGVPVDDIRALIGDRSEVRRELEVAEDTILVGTVANYHRKKDWPTLLRAARLVADAEVDVPVHFCAVGQGPLESSVEELHRELDLGSVVTLTGYQPAAVRLMAGCDAFVLASRWEGLPVALMEACVLGLPIIASAVGGVPDHFTDGVDARLIPAERPDLLAQAILDVVRDPALRQRLSAASVEHSRDFDARRTTAYVEDVYRDLVTRPGGRRGRP